MWQMFIARNGRLCLFPKVCIQSAHANTCVQKRMPSAILWQIIIQLTLARNEHIVLIIFITVHQLHIWCQHYKHIPEKVSYIQQNLLALKWTSNYWGKNLYILCLYCVSFLKIEPEIRTVTWFITTVKSTQPVNFVLRCGWRERITNEKCIQTEIFYLLLPDAYLWTRRTNLKERYKKRYLWINLTCSTHW